MTAQARGQDGAVGGVLAAYRDDLEAQGYRPETVRVRVGTVAAAASHADLEDPRELSRADVLDWLGSRDRADWTRIKYLSHLSAFCRWAQVEDVTEGLRRPRTPVGVPRPVDEATLHAMLDAPCTADEAAWVRLGAFCGLRSFESAKLARRDLEQAWDGSWLLRVIGKGQQLAVVPCPPVVTEALEVVAAEHGVRSGRYWPNASARTVQRGIRRVGEHVGVEVTSHRLRHRYGTAVYGASSDLLLTQRLMRHASPTTTAGYAAVAASRAHTVVAGLPGATRLPDDGRRLHLVR